MRKFVSRPPNCYNSQLSRIVCHQRIAKNRRDPARYTPAACGIPQAWGEIPLVMQAAAVASRVGHNPLYGNGNFENYLVSEMSVMEERHWNVNLQ